MITFDFHESGLIHNLSIYIVAKVKLAFIFCVISELFRLDQLDGNEFGLYGFSIRNCVLGSFGQDCGHIMSDPY